MRVNRVELVLRKDGFFEFDGKRIPAVHKGDGWAVMVFLEASQIDLDFGRPTLAITQDDYERIGRLLSESDSRTHDLLGRGWEGRKPSHRVEEFM